MGEEFPDKGLGVKWEGGLIYQHLYNAGANNSKFIPVLLRSSDAAFIPTPLQSATHYRVDSDKEYEKLYARLLNRPTAEKPKLGQLRPLPKKHVKTDISLYVSIPIDVDLWNKAKWRSTFFMIYEDLPPILGLGFLNEEPSRKIFEQWHERYGDRDTYEELRVSIIEGDIKGKEPGYTVHVGADIDNTIKRYKDAGLVVSDADRFMMVSRINRMNPPASSKNLELFKEAYRYHKTFLLIPGTHKPDGTELKPMIDLRIFKSVIHFRRVEEIGAHDLDVLAIGAAKISRPPTWYGKHRKGRNKTRKDRE
jgi:hypothetical protein